MAYNYQGMRKIPVDPRWVSKIQGSPRMAAEQGPDFLSGWGGPAKYQFLTELPMPERLVYAAVDEGYGTPEEIQGVTDLTLGEVSSALSSLTGKGLIGELQQ